MNLSAYAKPVVGIVIVAAIGGGYWAMHRSSHSKVEEPPSKALVIVTKSTNGCFSDVIRGTGYMVPRREAVVNVDTEGSKVTDLLVREGDTVTDNQELARLTPPPMPPQQGGRQSGPIVLRAPAAGLVTEVRTAVGAPASPQSPPMFRIAVNGDIEMNAEIPGSHILKLAPGAPARVTVDNGVELVGRVRLVAPVVNRQTQLGHVRISVPRNASIKVGMLGAVVIDAKRSCGVSIPRSAVDHLTVQVVKDNVVEMRQVRTGLTSANNVEILEGLREGEVVVADAGSSLHSGDQVKAVFADELDRSRAR